MGRLRAAVLLAGAVRANPFRRATGRSVLQMPLEPRRTVLEAWRDEMVRLSERFGLAPLAVRVMLDQAAAATPQPDGDHGAIALSIERDPSEFRGTGGLLSDLVRDYGDDQYVLVAPAAQLLLRPLSEMAAALAGVGADAAIACDTAGRPAGVVLIRCGVLRSISPVGFVDLNEQALPAIAKQHDVRVVRFEGPTSLPLRTLGGYIAGLAAYQERLKSEGGRRKEEGGGAEARAGVSLSPPQPSAFSLQPSAGLPPSEGSARFAVVEPGAQVHETVVVHDSVVLAGARVQRGAVLVRSVVGPGAVVPAGQSVIDAVVGPIGGTVAWDGGATTPLTPLPDHAPHDPGNTSGDTSGGGGGGGGV